MGVTQRDLPLQDPSSLILCLLPRCTTFITYHNVLSGMAKKNSFGGVKIDFSGRNFPNDTLEHIFGKKPVTPSEMTKKIWITIKRKQLMFVEKPKKNKKKRR